MFLGIAIGLWFWGAVSDTLVRRAGFLGTALFCAVFGLLSAFVTGPWALGACRFLVGFGLGGASVALSLFSEFLPTEGRGT